MLKYLILFFIIIFNLFPNIAQTQKLEAKYKVTKKIYSTDINGNQKQIATLQYEGFLYQKNNRTIYFQKPLYLSQYPDGNINIHVNDHYQISMDIPMDSMLHIYYMDFDSLITRSRTEFSGKLNNKEWNIKQQFSRGSMTWTLFPDTKEINGLKCQKATFTAPDGRLIYNVWFCPDLNALAGPVTIRDLPGLVVEAKCPVYNETYTLESYNTNISPPDKIFWPDIFYQPFR